MPAHCYISAIGSSPKTDIGEDRTLNLNELMVTFDVTEMVQFSKIYFGVTVLESAEERYLTYMNKVTVSLYHQCCARILPPSVG